MALMQNDQDHIYYKKWFDDLFKSSGIKLSGSEDAWGEFELKSGPNPQFARVRISLEPEATFTVEYDTLELNKLPQDYIDQIVFGVIDVALLHQGSSYINFRLTIIDCDFDHVRSSPKSFRMAARDAAKKVLDKLREQKYKRR